MAVFQSTYNRDLMYEIMAKKQPTVVAGVSTDWGALTCMGLSTDVSGVAADTFYEQRNGSGVLLKKGFYEGTGVGSRMIVAGRSDDNTGGTLGGPVNAGIGVGNVSTVHTSGSSSYTVSKTWGDVSGFGHGAWTATIGQVALYSAQAGGDPSEPVQCLGFIFVLATPIQMYYQDQPIFGGSGLVVTLTIDL